MPKQQLSFDLSLSPSDSLKAFQRAASQLGWHILSCNNSELVCQEVVNMPSVNWPAKVTITATANRSANTQVTLHSVIAGFRPIQSNHLKQQLETLVDLVSSQSGHVPSQSTKIERGFWEKLGEPIAKIGEEYFG